ncbi:Gfo/Idh/MocA family protein [Kordiimonas sp.]|uniref:Gfo/Idh/MocA family protein n=1 Tax=Kordiimonas sp. TaxID=1970157 RepID=UPI003A94AB71
MFLIGRNIIGLTNVRLKKMSNFKGVRKKIFRIWRATRMWGLHRTYAKIANRLSLPFPVMVYFVRRSKDTLLSGCGQFGSSTASFFIGRQFGNRFLGCYDIDSEQRDRVKKAYGYKYASDTFEALLTLPGAKRLFIASNHASHTEQAVKALKKGLLVHIEKPIAVTWEQLAELGRAVRGKEHCVFFGYNRPFSEAISVVRDFLPDGRGPFSIQHFIAGHVLEPGHWYFNVGEGTRICGNVGHWIDLTIHILSLRDVPDRWAIAISYSDPDVRDENFSLSMTSDQGDLVNMTFTARAEPFDGINESTNIQQGALMVKIDDYRTMKLWQHELYRTYKFKPKDVGHKKSTMQMFSQGSGYVRPWQEVYLSTLLMLYITDMVRLGITQADFSFAELRARIET